MCRSHDTYAFLTAGSASQTGCRKHFVSSYRLIAQCQHDTIHLSECSVAAGQCIWRAGQHGYQVPLGAGASVVELSMLVQLLWHLAMPLATRLNSQPGHAVVGHTWAGCTCLLASDAIPFGTFCVLTKQIV
jgi:hypothetical protein